VLSGRGLSDELITCPEESYRLCCVVVCDLETSRIGAPYIYDISHLRVKHLLHALDTFSHLDLNILRNLFLIALSEFFQILFGNVSILVMIAFPPLLIKMWTVKI
jgi:hypothetical protein